jgi:hypothetical protein
MTLHLHTSRHPPRVETYLGGQKCWAEATEPTETMNDVLRYFALMLLGAGYSDRHAVRVWPRGRDAEVSLPLGSLLL